jgi:hypothetical protein
MYHGINLFWVLGFKLRPLINLVEFFRKNPELLLKQAVFLLPEILTIRETLSFQQIVKHLFTEGTMPVLPPRTAPSLCDCVVLPSLELSLQGGCHSVRGRGVTCCRPKKSVKKNILGISSNPTIRKSARLCSIQESPINEKKQFTYNSLNFTFLS